jgi:hypothetical protein
VDARPGKIIMIRLNLNPAVEVLRGGDFGGNVGG